MPKVEGESSELEPVMKPFIDLANTEHWRGALNVLYLNGGVLNFLEGTSVPVLISFRGTDEGVEEMIDLLMGKAKADIIPLFGSVLKLFIPKLTVISQRKEFKDAGGQSQEAIGIMAFMELKTEWEKHQKKVSEAIIEGAFTIAHMLAAGTYKMLQDKRDIHIETTLDEETYEEMIDGLQKVGVIEPRLQATLCPQCGNYQLLISPSPANHEACPKCGTKWASQTLFTFAKPLDKFKTENNDLPLFISSYLRFKINSTWPMSEVEIFPNAQVLSEAGERVEIDVFLPQYQIGIECKSFEDCFAPLTDNRMSSIIGRLIPQIKRYISVGASRIFVITNLPADATQKVKDTLEKALARDNTKPEGLILIQGEVNVLLAVLDELGQTIGQKVADAFGKSMLGVAESPQSSSILPQPQTSGGQISTENPLLEK